ncbi:MAG: WXG100 family type VII secretion target [Jatrophihabitans sp.]
MSGFEVTESELSAAQAQARDVAAELRSGQHQLAAVVTDLLGGAWSGTAASAFASGWDEWLAGSGEVLDGLARTSVLLGATKTNYREGDELSASIINRLEGRL